MSILNVNQIQPVGSGQTVTISATNIDTGSATVTAGTFTGNLTGNVTGGVTVTSGNLTGITSVSTTNLTVNGNAYPSSGPLSNRNKIINGDMRIDQRNAGASVNVTSNVYTLDRWNCGGVNDGVLAMQRVSDGPSGFTNSLKVTVSTADSSLGTTQYARVGQKIEGFNVADFAGGTASAATVVLSFWIKSSVTGTYGGHIASGDESRVYVFQYTVNSANTWEYKSVAVTLSTSGTWATDNTAGMRIFFSLGCGSSFINTANTWLTSYAQQASGNVNLIETSSATWQLTGVQLEQGSVATPFEHRIYGDELARCQRYYEKSFAPNVAPADGPNATSYYTDNGIMTGLATNKNGMGTFISFAVKKRTTPDITRYGNSSGQWSYQQINSTTTTFSANLSAARIGTGGFSLNQQTVDAALVFVIGHWSATAEL